MNGFLNEGYSTSIGLPEGYCLSLMFFALFISDIDTIAEGRGVEFIDEEGNKKRILYLALYHTIGEDPEDLKNAMISLENYCRAKELIIKVTKTKILHSEEQRRSGTSKTFQVSRVEIYCWLELL